MHGRQKVEQSAEEEAKKQAERQKKITAYQYAMSKIFKKRANKEFDPDLLSLTAKVLAANPDIATLWNIRREVLSIVKADDSAKFMELVPSELELTEVGLRQNPKSYGCWHQRCWLMKETNFELVEQEMKLSSKFLQYDDRNFHCWDYRRYLVANNPNHSVENEIDFTTDKIKTNFSNYSSWHLRSKLIPRLTNELLADELDLIKNAAFTDPNDQSVWFYHKWLVNSHLQNVPPALTFVGHEKSQLYLTFNVDVLNPANLGFSVSVTLNTGETKLMESPWTNLWVKPKCKVWMIKVDAVPAESVSNFSISTDADWRIPKNFVNDHGSIVLLPGKKICVNSCENGTFSTFLVKELQWVQELHELEPENKWAILTLIHLLRLVDFRNNEKTIMELIETLKCLDNKRAQYYCDLRNKLTLEWNIIRQLELQPSVCPFILPPF
ncbi:unnamed protein product [Allacma fusca]|nr:unnamed protein product [Allacma fusca]